jgi:hypothetical protein
VPAGDVAHPTCDEYQFLGLVIEFLMLLFLFHESITAVPAIDSGFTSATSEFISAA